MKLYEIISNLKFIGIKNYREIDIDSLTCSSEEKTESGLYFCIKGMKHDGHNYAQQAINNGAICLVVERFLEVDVPQILVENVRIAMSQICSTFYGTYKSKMKFIGITGTNGKTTTTMIIRNILTAVNKKVGLIGTEGVYIGSLLLPPTLTTPDPIVLHKLIKDMEDNGCEYCVMEVSAHAIALNKIDNIYFDAVGLTNITKDHLDFFLNMENYTKCKASPFDYKHAKLGVINIDSKNTQNIAKNSNIEICKIGKDADLQLISTEYSLSGTEFSFSIKGKVYHSKTNLIGEYNISNIMLSIGILLKIGINVYDILRVIKQSEFVIPGRFNVINCNNKFSAIIDYAHTPDGIKNVLGAIKLLAKKKIITVFGCGGNRDKTKRREMCDVALNFSDLVIVTTDNPRYENPELIIDDIVRGVVSEKLVRITDRKSAIEYAMQIANENDVVAILGKGAENYQEIKGVKFPYSDFEVVNNFNKYSLKGKIKAW